ncbi:fungal hydrophobin-domain-containing protein [Cytidiella melzeri]|nr:fungal hydrophobin-domain-containing protein [Cytidiella melzeri]
MIRCIASWHCLRQHCHPFRGSPIAFSTAMRTPTLAACLFSTLSLLAVATPAELHDKRGSSTTATTPSITTTLTVTAPASTVTAASQCNGTASLQCCEEAVAGDSILGRALLGLLGLVVTEVDILLGLDCSPIPVIAVGSGDACSATPVCCENNSVDVPISIGCVVITL